MADAAAGGIFVYFFLISSVKKQMPLLNFTLSLKINLSAT